ncbi:hypothetical protein, partial [Bacillus cereus]|uniref:hypothetical protein n=1 Tax=Bacillus cereus TaxID=1396 RepID=UPI00211169B3
TPVCSWKVRHSFDNDQINGWLGLGGWIGGVVPKGIFIVDIDDSKECHFLRELLEGENIHHQIIKTPNGWQFIFKGET